MKYLKIVFIIYTVICIIDALLLYKKYSRIQKSQEDMEQLKKTIKRNFIFLVIFILMGFILITLR